ncbi:GH1 family beta-glucosidase [Frigidibacter sp. ROC022]|uniref:GH1 family beta-glucosidase n=1 Tax=Frigidibacter sp. ROC022 TaxID=2971796 RepID=UPI00215B02E8|nr:GH1 family beta-glucosidase [Frigidibacter sp. ROC022]MCR8723947.1 GH1 family beta-glucosidase [Frigidibacter sp. ROC022]
MALTRNDFPEGFLFGAATAAYQIEGARFGGCGSSHWDSFARTPGNVAGAEDGSLACDHYHHWEADLDLLKDGNFDAYRFSTSWARVLPEGRGKPNPEGLDFYDRLVDGILERGLKPFQTLYHWELPSALADLGGWENRDVAQWFGDFTEVIDARIGDRVARIATINEPWCVAWLSHFLGVHAPGKRDIRAATRAMHHVLLAHGTAVQRLRARGRDNLGVVLNFDFCDPASNAQEDWKAADLNDQIFNRWYIEGITRGAYPPELLGALAPHMPEGWQDDMGLISQELDWLGVNYYTRHIHAADPGAPWPATKQVEGHLPKTQSGWEIYPDGLYHFLMRAHEETGGLPIFVTENGMAWDDRIENGAVPDPEREAYIDRHLAAVRMALADGANVQGFFYWSLLDNYEWAEGYEKRFGLVHVDYETQVRTPKASYHHLARMLERR